jgi:hypothetical protein
MDARKADSDFTGFSAKAPDSGLAINTTAPGTELAVGIGGGVQTKILW